MPFRSAFNLRASSVAIKSVTSNVIQETEILEKIENSEIKKQLELINSFLPDELINTGFFQIKKITYLSGFLLMGNIYGVTTFCEEFQKYKSTGTLHLISCLNAYFGILIEIIYFYKGDLINLRANEFTVLWKIGETLCFEKARQECFSCALTLKNSLGNYKTGCADIIVSMKMAIEQGGISFNIIGDGPKEYFVLGDPINRGRELLEKAEGDEILIGTKVADELSKPEFQTQKVGNVVTLIDLIYDSKNTMSFREKASILMNLCKMYEASKNQITPKKGDEAKENVFNNIEPLVRNIPEVYSIRNMPVKITYLHARDFVIPRLYNQVDNNAPILDICGRSNIIVQYIYFIPSGNTVSGTVDTIEEIYKMIVKVIFQLYGIVDRLIFIDDAVIAVVYYGYKGPKNYILYVHAFQGASKILREIRTIACIKYFSITHADSNVFTIAAGHPARREYISVGYIFSRLLILCQLYPCQITCDYLSFKKSKLSSDYFKVLSSNSLDLGLIFEFRDVLEDFSDKIDLEPLIGRNMELDIILHIVQNPFELGDYYAVCFHSKPHMGKTTLLKHACKKMKDENYCVASVILPDGPQRPLFTLSHLYQQLYNSKATLHSPELKNIVDLPSSLWDCKDYYQSSSLDKQFQFKKKVDIVKAVRELISLGQHSMALFFIDNIEHIDISSLEILQILLNEKIIRLITAGTFTNDRAMDIKWKMCLCDKIKVLELKDIENNFIGKLISNMLNISAIPAELCELIQNMSHGNPGLLKLILDHFKTKSIVQEATLNLKNKKEKNRHIIFEKEQDDNHSKISSVIFFKEKLPEEKFTVQSMYYDLLLSYSVNEQSVLTSSAMLGPIFRKNTLKQYLGNPPDPFMEIMVKKLFETGIYDCASKYLLKNSFGMEEGSCECSLDEKDIKEIELDCGYSLPKYAFCKLIFFKNKYFRTLVQEVVDKPSRQQLHLQIGKFLEEQLMVCPVCENNNFISTYRPQKFKSFLKEFNESHIIYNVDNDLSDLEKQPEFVKDIIRRQIKNNSGEGPIIEGEEMLCPKLKIFCTSCCFCIDFLLKTYWYLIENNEEAQHLAKRLFFLVEFAQVFTSLGEHLEAKEYVLEADLLCSVENFEKSKFFVSVTFLNIFKAKIKRLQAEIEYSLGKYEESKQLVVSCFKHLEIPIALSQHPTPSIIDKILSKALLKKYSFPKGEGHLKSPAFKVEIASCFSLISRIFKSEENFELANLASLSSLVILNNKKANIPLATLINENVLNVQANENNYLVSEVLLRVASNVFHINVEYYDLHDVFSSLILASKMFEVKVLNADYSQSIIMGYNLLHCLKQVGADDLVVSTSTLLSSILLNVQQIKDAVELMKNIFALGKSVNEEYSLNYHVLCLELHIEGSFMLEPIDRSIEYANYYISEKPYNYVFNDMETKLILLLAIYYIRSNQYNLAVKWRAMLSEIKIQNASYLGASNMFLNLQFLLIQWSINITEGRSILEEINKIKKSYKNCQSLATRWIVFLPRFYHFKAYFYLLKHQRRQCRKLLKDGFEIAQQQGNILEYSWLRCSDISWRNFNFFQEQKVVPWNMASNFNSLEWAHILYNLPYFS